MHAYTAPKSATESEAH